VQDRRFRVLQLISITVAQAATRMACKAAPLALGCTSSATVPGRLCQCSSYPCCHTCTACCAPACCTPRARAPALRQCAARLLPPPRAPQHALGPPGHIKSISRAWRMLGRQKKISPAELRYNVPQAITFALRASGLNHGPTHAHSARPSQGSASLLRCRTDAMSCNELHLLVELRSLMHQRRGKVPLGCRLRLSARLGARLVHLGTSAQSARCARCEARFPCLPSSPRHASCCPHAWQ